jgi:glucan phosphoethanolaminetransferase (alkaline phosphatase superfamily)
MRVQPWRLLFFLAALLILVGAPQHPRGTMAQMLAHPKWVAAHVLVLAGFLALLGGLVLFGRPMLLSARTKRWTRIAAIGSALQAFEMVFHTAAVMDLHHLTAGESTPVLSIHLALSLVCYPLFAASLVGFIIACLRDHTLGSPWIAWIGILGAICHGAAPVLVVGLQWNGARILFPFIILLALWLALAAAWPVRSPQLLHRQPVFGGD